MHSARDFCNKLYGEVAVNIWMWEVVFQMGKLPPDVHRQSYHGYGRVVPKHQKVATTDRLVLSAVFGLMANHAPDIDHAPTGNLSMLPSTFSKTDVNVCRSLWRYQPPREMLCSSREIACGFATCAGRCTGNETELRIFLRQSPALAG